MDVMILCVCVRLCACAHECVHVSDNDGSYIVKDTVLMTAPLHQ